jgi:peptidoglycan/xylan/chitin deacetylase (PgdA/CDA1 family)
MKAIRANKTIYLSFDIEEFDVPLEYGATISLEEQISISVEGNTRLLDLLQKHNICATFFSTVVYAQKAPVIIKRIINEGHELASHGWYHSSFDTSHLRQSKIELEKLSGVSIQGYRMARMMPVSSSAIEEAGYQYNSSLNPVYLPGRYNNYFKPRKPFYSGLLLEVPASATPVIRIPLFWLTFHSLPEFLYRLMCRATITTDRYLNLYFHPWEFADISDSRYKLPGIIKRKTGQEMVEAFDRWIQWAKNRDYQFRTMNTLLS